MKLRDLTKGERALIYRRREGMSQRQAAAHHGMTLYSYRQWENDTPLDAEAAGYHQERLWPKLSLHRLEPWEACFILRRRSGISLEELAKTIGVSRWWLCKMEYGRENANRLIEHWRSKSRPWRGSAAATTVS